MVIKLFNFSKRKNSTKRPTGGTTIQVKLKDTTTFHSPSFLLDGISLGQYNYIEWDNRYYYIIEQQQVTNDLVELDCEMDYLATYYNDIKSTTAFVVYSTSKYNKWIVDNRLSMSPQANYGGYSQEFGNDLGCYFVTYITSSNTNCGVIYSSQLSTLARALISDDLLTSLLNDAENYLSKKLNSTSDAIVECHYLPFRPTLGSGTNLILGKGYNTGVTIYPVSHNTKGSLTFNIPFNYNDFRDRSEYTKLYLYLPSYGAIQLNADDFIDENVTHPIVIEWSLDPYSGDLSYLIDGRIKCTCNIAVSVQIGSVSGKGIESALSALSGGVAAVGGIMSGNGALALSGASTYMSSLISTASVDLGSVGSNGGASAWNVSEKKITLFVISHNTTIEPSSMAEKYGRPLNEVTSLQDLIGYVQTADVSVQTNDDIANANINSMLNGGVYLE